jgi:hypothetical protein
VPLTPSGATVRVSDGAGAGECVDVPSALGGGELLLARGPGGALVGHIESLLSSGRCAGPLPHDLAALALRGRRSSGKHPSFDLSGSQSFAAGPFTGRLVSTLVVTTGAGNGGSGSFTTTSGPATVARPVPTHRELREQVTLRYRIASLPGTLDASFQGEPDPFCTALDSCGATGSLALSLPGFRQTLVVQASRTVPSQLDSGQVLADFKRGLLQPQGGGASRAGTTAKVAETFSGSGALPCQDTAQNRQARLSLFVGPAAAGGRASVSLQYEPDSELIRTYCPGPTDTDVFGTFPPVARTSIDAAQLLARHSVISLASHGTFAGFGYVGSRSGALRFSLTLEGVRAGTVEVMRP